MSLSNDINEEIAVLRGNRKMRDTTIYNIRRFLNKAGYHSTAFIFANLTKTVSKGRKSKKTGKVGKDHVWYSTELKISDCDRMINLSIDTHSKRSVNNTLHKLDVLIDTLKEFRKLFAKEMNSHFKNKNISKG